ncbi:MAG: hypothetical protein L3K02_07260 [Thermoplasmata archaeon]|nr:hypothetical protein [Thermoplasmata archaeon]
MATALRDLPKYLVLSGVSTVRLEMLLESPACEIDVELENPKPGRSFVLLIGHKEGPYVQRVRLSGRARIHFDPQAPGEYLLLLANPNREPLVLRLKARDLVSAKRSAKRRRSGPGTRASTVKRPTVTSMPRSKKRSASARPTSGPPTDPEA